MHTFLAHFNFYIFFMVGLYVIIIRREPDLWDFGVVWFVLMFELFEDYVKVLIT